MVYVLKAVLEQAALTHTRHCPTLTRITYATSVHLMPLGPAIDMLRSPLALITRSWRRRKTSIRRRSRVQGTSKSRLDQGWGRVRIVVRVRVRVRVRNRDSVTVRHRVRDRVRNRGSVRV